MPVSGVQSVRLRGHGPHQRVGAAQHSLQDRLQSAAAGAGEHRRHCQGGSGYTSIYNIYTVSRYLQYLHTI